MSNETFVTRPEAEARDFEASLTEVESAVAELFASGIEDRILPAARELGIGITAYGVLSRGLISGHWRKESLAAGDSRVRSPRFQGSNIDANLALVEALRKIAADKKVSVAQIAIAWVAQQGRERPSVGGDVVHHQQQDVLACVQVEQMSSQGRCAGEVEAGELALDHRARRSAT